MHHDTCEIFWYWIIPGCQSTLRFVREQSGFGVNIPGQQAIVSRPYKVIWTGDDFLIHGELDYNGSARLGGFSLALIGVEQHQLLHFTWHLWQ